MASLPMTSWSISHVLGRDWLHQRGVGHPAATQIRLCQCGRYNRSAVFDCRPAATSCYQMRPDASSRQPRRRKSRMRKIWRENCLVVDLTGGLEPGCSSPMVADHDSVACQLARQASVDARCRVCPSCDKRNPYVLRCMLDSVRSIVPRGPLPRAPANAIPCISTLLLYPRTQKGSIRRSNASCISLPGNQ